MFPRFSLRWLNLCFLTSVISFCSFLIVVTFMQCQTCPSEAYVFIPIVARASARGEFSRSPTRQTRTDKLPRAVTVIAL